MAAQAPLAADTSPSPWPTVARAVVLLTAAIGVLLTAFAWPSVRSSVHDVPIAVAGPAAAVEQISAALDQRLPGAFAITEVADTAAAEQLIRDRQVYDAIDVSIGTPQVIIASAASAAVAQTLQNVATALSQAQAQGTRTAAAVRDLAPLPADDPRGAGLAAGALPLVMGGLLAALLRSTAFFDGDGATHSVIVLITWLALGVVLCLASGLRTRRTASVAGMAAQPAARGTA
jgi:hypothetical protein